MHEAGQSARDDDTDESPPRDGVDRWVMPYVRDSTLWPILFVMLANVVAFVAPVILYTIRDRHLTAIAALLATLYLTLGIVRYDLRRSSRPAALSAIALLVWIASFVAAYYGDRSGFL